MVNSRLNISTAVSKKITSLMLANKKLWLQMLA